MDLKICLIFFSLFDSTSKRSSIYHTVYLKKAETLFIHLCGVFLWVSLLFTIFSHRFLKEKNLCTEHILLIQYLYTDQILLSSQKYPLNFFTIITEIIEFNLEIFFILLVFLI